MSLPPGSMNPPPDGGPEAPAARTAPAAPSAATRPMYWSVRRELWENRSVYLAPVAVAGVILSGFLVRALTLPRRMRSVVELDVRKQFEAVAMPYNVVAGLTLMTAFIVAVFYCLDALHGERRDRSILFWKSLPVSDLTTVLSKASIPLVVLPLVVFAIVVACQMVMLVLSTLVLMGSADGLQTFWARLPLVQMWVALLYALTTITLWHAPIYAWLLLVSGWARRATFLWAALPFIAVCIFEMIAFHTAHFARWIRYRLVGWFTQAFVLPPRGSAPLAPLAALDPGRFLATPGLWLGLIVAAALLAATVRLRREHGPI